MRKPDSNDRLTPLPIGTQVVTLGKITTPDGTQLCPQGALGVILRTFGDPGDRYLVRFPDGTEATIARHDLTIRRHFQHLSVYPEDKAYLSKTLKTYVIYQCIVGSRAYGLDDEGSDTDRRGIYLPPADIQWSLVGVPEQLEDHETQECYWELQKFLTLALRANPNILESLFTPLVEVATPLARELLAMRSSFLSQLVYQTYNGYVMSQFRKLGQDLRNVGRIRWKHAMHLIRLLLSGVEVLRTGIVPVRVGAHREELLAIRRGDMTWQQIDDWRLQLHKDFDAALATTQLPLRPDYEKANEFLVHARRSMVS